MQCSPELGHGEQSKASPQGKVEEMTLEEIQTLQSVFDVGLTGPYWVNWWCSVLDRAGQPHGEDRQS